MISMKMRSELFFSVQVSDSIGSTGNKASVVTTSTNYVVAAGLDVVLVDAPVSISLPDAAAMKGRVITITSIDPSAVVTVDTQGGNVHGQATQIVHALESITAVSDIANWWLK